MGKRTRQSGSNYDPQSAAANTYSEYSGAQKNVPSGWARSRFIGDATTAKAILPGQNFAIYNNAGAVAFVSFYPTGSAVAADSTNGVPIPPNDYLYLNSSDNDFVIASAATVLIYEIRDETSYQRPPA
jgi:hypothetical protein